MELTNVNDMSTVKTVSINHIKRDMKELELMQRAFEEGSTQRELLKESVDKLKEVLILEGVEY